MPHRSGGRQQELEPDYYSQRHPRKAGQTGLARYFRRIVSSHDLGVPKEHPQFWTQLQAELAFDPARCLFVDDSIAVLNAARAHGIGHIFAISRPDSTQHARTIDGFETVERIEELLAG
jgi:putative hydrolase of the HAD superfamily